MTYTTIFNEAIAAANQAAQVAAAQHPESNGSEAWHAVVIRVDGRSAIAKELKAAGVEKDFYWGLIATPTRNGDCASNYYGEDAWAETLAGKLNQAGIKARPVERLL